MKISIIIPVYNEAKTIRQILAKVKRLPIDKKIIVVDDGSSDRGGNYLAKLAKAKTDRFKIVTHPRNLGKGAAVRTGLNLARGRFVIIQDADLEYNPTDILKLLKESDGNNAVFGSRYLHLPGGWPPGRWVIYLANRFLSAVTNRLFGSRLTDIETCYKLIPKRIYTKLNLESSGFEVEAEITAKILKMGHSIKEVPIQTKPRSYREGKKITAKDGFFALVALFKYRFS